MKKWILILISLLVALLLCFNCLKFRRYIELNYISEHDYTKNFYHDDYNLPKDCEFTWWEHYSNYGWTNVVEDYYGVSFDKNFEKTFDMSKVDVVISFGRKLDKLYYDEKYHYDKLNNGLILAVPVFKKEYRKNKIYVYTTNRKYDIFDNEYWTNEMSEFNVEGKVRFNEE
jgi:hypothetical protein